MILPIAGHLALKRIGGMQPLQWSAGIVDIGSIPLLSMDQIKNCLGQAMMETSRDKTSRKKTRTHC